MEVRAMATNKERNEAIIAAVAARVGRVSTNNGETAVDVLRECTLAMLVGYVGAVGGLATLPTDSELPALFRAVEGAVYK
jgi:hypothetical protein